jgi:hypothetical protein
MSMTGYRSTVAPRWAVNGRQRGIVCLVPLPGASDPCAARQVDLEAQHFELQVDGAVVGRVLAQEISQ